jgi:hypothetical protein
MKTDLEVVTEFEGLLMYLMSFVSKAKEGVISEAEYRSSSEYVRQKLIVAETALRNLGMYDAVKHAIDESQRLIAADTFDEADQLLLNTVREMMERSGTHERLRRQYSPSAKH